MKSSLYVIHDRLTQQFGEVFESYNDAAIRRSFIDIFKQQRCSGVPVKDLAILCVATCDKSGSVPVVLPVPVPYTVLRGDEISYDQTSEISCAACPGTCGQEAFHDSVPEA